MRSTITMLTAVLLVVLGAGTAVAQEIVHFTNGTTMPVAGHEVDGEMIRVDLGDDGWLAFPRAQVERIEAAGREVFPTDAGPANRMVDVEGRRTFPVKGRRPGKYSRPAGAAAAAAADPAVDKDANGIPVYRPFIDSRNPAARKIGATGHSAVVGGDADTPRGRASGPTRTHQIGAQRHDKSGTTGGKPKVTGIERRAGGSPPPAPSAGSGGDGN